MGGRYLISGVQIALLRTVENDNSLRTIGAHKRMLSTIIDEQFIDNSANTLNDDVKYAENAFRSKRTSKRKFSLSCKQYSLIFWTIVTASLFIGFIFGLKDLAYVISYIMLLVMWALGFLIIVKYVKR